MFYRPVRGSITIAVTSTFTSKEDFEHYGTQRGAHEELKAFAGSAYWEI